MMPPLTRRTRWLDRFGKDLGKVWERFGKEMFNVNKMDSMKNKEKENGANFAEANVKIRDGIGMWAEIMLMSEADGWAYKLNYFPRDIMNAVYIFQHVLSNVGIKKGIIDEEKAVVFGKRLRELVKDMTGYDPVAFFGGAGKEKADS